MDYAGYAAHKAVDGGIGPSCGAVMTPSTWWIKDHHGGRITAKANNPYLAAALARAGTDRVVLPMFAGERAPGLTRLSDPIEDLRSEEWLVSHHDARNEPAIRAALDAIGYYLRSRP